MFLPQNAPECVWQVGSVSLQLSSRHPSWIKEGQEGRGEKEKRNGKKGGGRRNPRCEIL